MASYSRQELINAGIRNNLSYNQINRMLNDSGYKGGYNPLLQLENYKQLPKRAIENATNMARDLRTFGGYIVKPLSDASIAAHEAKQGDKINKAKEAFKKSISNDNYRKTFQGMLAGGALGSVVPKVGLIGGAMLGASLGMEGGNPKELANAILSTYDTSVDNLKHTSPQQVIQGMFRNPLYVGLDTAPLTGKAISKFAKSIPENSPYWMRQLLPDEKTRQFNRQISNSISGSKAKSSKNYTGYLNLEQMPYASRRNILENIITNKGKLNREEQLLADTIKTNLRDVENEFIERGYGDRKLFKDNAVSQYVMYNLPDKTQLVHDDIMNIINGNELRTGNQVSETLRKDILKLAKEGEKLYDDKKISFFTQQLMASTDPNVIARNLVGEDRKGYFDTARIIGKQDLDKLSSVFDRSVKHQLDQFNKYLEVEDTISDLVHNYNIERISKDNIGLDIPENKVALSLEEFKNNVKDSFAKGNELDIIEALNRSNVKKEGAYLLDRLYLDMIKNAFTKRKGNQTDRLLSSFKKTVLANPHWIMLNRVGNFTNNLIDGVTLKDYQDVKTANRLGIIPEQLKQQTSFNSYVNSLETGENLVANNKLTSTMFNSMKTPISKFKSDLNMFKNSRKSLGDVAKLLASGYSSLSDVSANPWYKLEATLEYTDRSANMIKQAKQLGKETGRDWKSILKQASSDNKLFSELNNGVNKALGDYIGRNYAMPTELYNKLSEAVPFYRFLTQTFRTTGNQLINNPLGFMSNVTIPARVGNDFSEYIINKYGLDRDKYQGGIPYLQEGNNIRTIGFEPLPIASVLESFGNIGEGKNLTQLLSPYWSTFPDILSFRKFDRTATSPRQTEMKLAGDEEGIRNYKPTLGEITAYALNTLGQTTFHPYKMSTTIVPEFTKAALGEGLQSRYDTSGFRENPLSYKRTLPTELVGKSFGIQTYSNFPKNKKESRYKKNRRKQYAKYAKKDYEANLKKK